MRLRHVCAMSFDRVRSWRVWVPQRRGGGGKATAPAAAAPLPMGPEMTGRLAGGRHEWGRSKVDRRHGPAVDSERRTGTSQRQRAPFPKGGVMAYEVG